MDEYKWTKEIGRAVKSVLLVSNSPFPDPNKMTGRWPITGAHVTCSRPRVFLLNPNVKSELLQGVHQTKRH